MSDSPANTEAGNNKKTATNDVMSAPIFRFEKIETIYSKPPLKIKNAKTLTKSSIAHCTKNLNRFYKIFY